MTDQNLVIGDAPYPNRLAVKSVPVEDTTSFVKGELCTFDANGFLTKLTTTKITGLVQTRNAVTGGAADGDVTVSVNDLGTRILAVLPADAKKGDLLQINGSDGVNDLVVSAATVDTANLAVGRLFDLYRNAAEKSSANDLGVVDLGTY